MAENLDKPFDDLFRDSIESLSEMPEKYIWLNIEHQLDKDNSDKYKRKYIFYKKTAGILLLLLLGFATYNVFSTRVYRRLNIPNFPVQNINLRNNYSSNLHFKNNINTRKGLGKSLTHAGIVYINKYEKILPELLSSAAAPFLIANNDGANKDVELQSRTSYNKLNLSEISLQPEAFQIINLLQGSLQKINFKNPFSIKLIPVNLKSIKRNHLFISAFAAPEYANYTMEDNEVNPYENKQVIQNRETHLLSFSTGILFNYEGSKKVSIQSGVTYSSSNININPSEIYAEKDNSGSIKYRYSTSSGYGYILPAFSAAPAIGDSIFTRTSVHNLQFITIPLVIHYKFINKKFSINPGVGISTSFLTAASLTTEVKSFNNAESEVITNLYGLKKVNFSFLLTSDLQYRLSEKWFLIASPYLKYSLAPINKQDIVKTYPYNIGLGLGAKYELD